MLKYDDVPPRMLVILWFDTIRLAERYAFVALDDSIFERVAEDPKTCTTDDCVPS